MNETWLPLSLWYIETTRSFHTYDYQARFPLFYTFAFFLSPTWRISYFILLNLIVLFLAQPSNLSRSFWIFLFFYSANHYFFNLFFETLTIFQFIIIPILLVPQAVINLVFSQRIHSFFAFLISVPKLYFLCFRYFSQDLSYFKLWSFWHNPFSFLPVLH